MAKQPTSELALATQPKPHLGYRFYGQHYAIVVDWKRKNTHLLTGVVAEVWQSITARLAPLGDINAQAVAKLAKLGLLNLPASGTPSPPDLPNTVPSAGQSLISRWAAANLIPINGSFELTGTCNLRCVHCYSVHQRVHNLTTSQILTIADRLREAGCVSLTLTGGELFMRRDWQTIFQHLSDNNFTFRVNTNGTYITEDVARTLMDYPQLSHVHVSVYSDDPAIHDRITLGRGSWAKSIAALEYLTTYTDKNVRINCTVMRENYPSYRQVKTAIGDPMGIPVRYDARLVAMDDGDTTNLVHRIDDADLRDHYRWMLDQGLVTLERLISPKQTQPDQVGLCSAGFSYFSVAYDGTLYPCFQLRQPLGSLLDNDFHELWQNDPFLRQLRTATPATLHDCVGCKLKPYCNLCIGMSHLEEGDVFGRSTECCRDAQVRSGVAGPHDSGGNS